MTGVPIDGFCRPSSSPQAIAAGCTGKDGAALTDSSTACGMCSGGFFLFTGGCYDTCPYGDGQTPNTCADAPVGGSSVNLSTGAIAGISVAAVVVVGGLGGFLCWWFMCRGKA